MEITTIRGEPRQAGGRHANERLRRRGLVPAVIYGHNQPPQTVAVSRHDLELALLHMRHVIQLDLGGQPAQYLLKDVQFDHLQRAPLHVDLMRVSQHDRVHLRVALELKGEPRGIHEGGELVVLLTDLDLECPLDVIPTSIVHNIRDIGVGQALHVRDIPLPPGVKARHNPDDLVAVVRTKRGVTVAAAAAAAEEAAPAGPEVIGKGPKEKEGADEE